MQSTHIRQIKAAIWDQAFTGRAQVWCPMGGVVAIRRRKGQLLAMVRGWVAGIPLRVSELSVQDKSFSCRE